MHILIAGATGVVGRRIVPLLVADGHQVTGLTRSPGRAAALRALGAEPVVTDVVDREGLIAAVRSAAPDVVVHQLTDRTCAACPSWSPPWPSYRSGSCCATACSTVPTPGTRRTG